MGVLVAVGVGARGHGGSGVEDRREHPGRRVARAGRQRVCGLERGGVRPVQGRGEPQWKKEANSEHAKLRSPGERAIAQLKNWRVLRKLRCYPQRAEETARTVLFFQLREARG